MQLLRFEHRAMACRWELLVPADSVTRDDEASLRQWVSEEFESLDRLELELSRFVDSSDVSRIRRLVSGESAVVGWDTVRCLQIAREVYDVTDGTFDIALGAGLEALHWDPTTRTVWVESETPLPIDLGGIAKGYALDELTDSLRDTLLEEDQVSGALIHGGQSSVRALGVGPGGEAWRLPLRHPLGESGSVGGWREVSVELREAVLSGSAAEAKRHHVRDPRAAHPNQSEVDLDPQRATWVVANDGAWSDALSTAAWVLGRRELEQRWPAIEAAAPGARAAVWQDGELTDLGGFLDGG